MRVTVFRVTIKISKIKCKKLSKEGNKKYLIKKKARKERKKEHGIGRTRGKEWERIVIILKYWITQ